MTTIDTIIILSIICFIIFVIVFAYISGKSTQKAKTVDTANSNTKVVSSMTQQAVNSTNEDELKANLKDGEF